MGSQLQNILQDLPIDVPTSRGDMRKNFALYVLERLAEDIYIRIHFKDSSAPIEVGNEAGEEYILFVNQPETLWDMMRVPDPGIGDAYIAGQWSLYKGDLGGFLSSLAGGYQTMMHGLQGRIFRRLFAQKPVQRPYDLTTRHVYARKFMRGGQAFFTKMLGEELRDQMAYYDEADFDLKQAQDAHDAKLIRDLKLENGLRVLDIACGWGGRANAIASGAYETQINALTNHEAQYHYAKQVMPRDLHRSVLNYYVQDYREHAENHGSYYDRIVSAYMLERAGATQEKFLRTMRHMMRKDGALHLMSVIQMPAGRKLGVNNSWMAGHIAPGAFAVDLHVLEDLVQDCGLRVAGLPALEDSYHGAITAQNWRENIQRGHKAIESLISEEQYRIWEFYLASLQALFENELITTGHVVLKRA